jgi:adenylate cyclase class 2
MHTEYEATFKNIDKDDVRARLKKAGAKLVRKEFLQKRTVFNPPGVKGYSSKWLRVRDEGDKITMSLKAVNGGKIEDQKEVCLEVNDYKEACNLLASMGCVRKAYQETKREIWMLEDVEICIDEWPYLEPFVEVEGKSEEIVKEVSEKIGFDYLTAYFGAVDGLYAKKYGVSPEIINNKTEEIVFEGDNPFADQEYD